MISQTMRLFLGAQKLAHLFSMMLIIAAATVLVILSILSAFSVLPWLTLPMTFGNTTYEMAGVLVQVLVTLLFISLCFYLPANLRILKLERAHHDFQLRTEDVARAYQISHQADRDGVFRIGGEFDEIRDRINFQRTHPDLAKLEPEVLELAAQMSHQSKELAEIYATEKVERARLFLTQRQQEVEKIEASIKMAKQTIGDMRRWLLQVETDETIAERQLDQLEEDLLELLPQLGFDLSFEVKERNVVSMPNSKKNSKEVKT
ncbi:DNA repair protein [Cochlodiniinecator piscidefendens]|uniref:DNA repair protein n=1 Tax=Cochlodiniinecator piscidefendens TaxID=2715756 RepID=UPI00140DC873|nr:DNA repair protein [Cochlodiniinecator piscidefendens]